MGKQHILLTLFSLSILAHASDIATRNFHHATEKATYFQIYVQDIFSGPNPTLILVASPNSTSTSPTSFGRIVALDDPIRLKPSKNSKIIGRAQGFFGFASLEETSIHMSFDLLFTSGEYKGSVLNLVGRNPYLRKRRELAIVGGSGAFRLARGFVEVRTVSLDSSTGDAFFEYNVTVLHY